MPTSDLTSLALSPEDIWHLARRHPVYAGLALDSERFEDLPTLGKATMDAALKRYLATPEHRCGLYLSPSGGSTTQVRMNFPVAIEENRLQRRWFGRIIAKVGVIPPSAIALNLFTGRLMYRSLEIFNDFCEQAGATVLPIESSIPDAAAAELAWALGANTLLGEPARLTQFARFVLDSGRPLPLERLVYGGESLREAQRNLLRTAFPGVAILSIYGTAETGIWAYRQESVGLDVFHYDPRMIHLEILDTDEDGVGSMVVTNLVRRRIPILRYHTGDRAAWINRSGDLHTFRLVGREAGSFTLNGESVRCDDVAGLLRDVVEWQVRLSFDAASRRDLLEARVVPPNGWTEERRREAERALRTLVGSEGGTLCAVRVREVASEDLERSPVSRKILKLIDTRRA